MTSLGPPIVRDQVRDDALPVADATLYAGWFSCLADPTRVRLLHQVATSPAGIHIGEIAEALGIGQPTVSHHVRKLTDAGFVTVHKEGTATLVTVNPHRCTELPHTADAVMGILTPQPPCPDDLPGDVTVRAMTADDWAPIRAIFAARGSVYPAVFATDAPSREVLDEQWLPDHRWVAESGGRVVGWAALTPVSGHEFYRDIADSCMMVADELEGRGLGTALLRRQVTAAEEAGLRTLQTTLFPEDRTAISVHHAAGFRTVGIRERIGRFEGRWRDAVLLERRSPLN
ncbi:helix-turn-helix domain-containing GNAT family N-acetyltransferase [Nocardia sp. NPDC051750]|uniref:helix-turn-helix domain-containing GNAT family N-acetyltransferase n=1 Tax=Nocardia sp. NPDC051750 TaxID=3364325 RepID=UPI0037BB9BA3